MKVRTTGSLFFLAVSSECGFSLKVGLHLAHKQTFTWIGYSKGWVDVMVPLGRSYLSLCMDVSTISTTEHSSCTPQKADWMVESKMNLLYTSTRDEAAQEEASFRFEQPSPDHSSNNTTVLSLFFFSCHFPTTSTPSYKSFPSFFTPLPSEPGNH
ncbi:hypothetical protein HDV57DRAFT_360800 [Trichoderma longibrachiatum]